MEADLLPSAAPLPVPRVEVFGRVFQLEVKAEGVETLVDQSTGRLDSVIFNGWSQAFSAQELESGKWMMDLPCAGLGLRCGDLVRLTIERIPEPPSLPTWAA